MPASTLSADSSLETTTRTRTLLLLQSRSCCSGSRSSCSGEGHGEVWEFGFMVSGLVRVKGLGFDGLMGGARQMGKEKSEAMANICKRHASPALSVPLSPFPLTPSRCCHAFPPSPLPFSSHTSDLWQHPFPSPLSCPASAFCLVPPPDLVPRSIIAVLASESREALIG
jgi:hypothetical protein